MNIHCMTSIAPQARKRISDDAIEHLDATNQRPRLETEQDRLAIAQHKQIASVITLCN